MSRLAADVLRIDASNRKERAKWCRAHGVRPDVAALFVERGGPYYDLLGEDRCWGVDRDARTYAGPWPVVAHPPCGPWGRLRHLCTRQDRSLAVLAVLAVRTYGGVLEHPEWSGLFDHEGMPRPGELPDAYGGVTIAVAQCDWGHVARKRSWIYMVGVRELGALPPRREPTHWVSGTRAYGKRGTCPPAVKICSAQQRRRTPPAFAAWLVSLAAQSRREAAGLDPEGEVRAS